MPRLIFHDSDGIDRTIDLGSEPILIGRSSECQVQTQDALVSRRHARIVWEGGFWIEDLGSSNGVYIGGEKVQKAPFRPGDEVRCGSLVMRLVPDVSRSSFAKQQGAGTPPPPPPPVAAAPPPPPPDATPRAPRPPVPPPTARPRMTTAPPPLPPPVSASAVAAASVPDLSPQLEEERKRRMQAESAVLTAEQRAGAAENRVQALEQRLADEQAQLQEAEGRAQSFEASAKESDKLRRKVDQLGAELRRLRGGAAPQVEEVTNTDAGPSVVMFTEVTAERDRLRLRVAELEEAAHRSAAAAPVAAPEGGGGEAPMLRRKVEQLTAELRRIRGGLPPTPPVDDEKIAALEARAMQAERERDEARKAAGEVRPAEPRPSDGNSAELDKLKRMVDLLSAENRRLRQGAPASALPAPNPDDPRLAELTAKVGQLEQERDALKRAAASAPRPAASVAAAGPAGGPPDPAVADAVAAIDDALADLRGSLRAANDEVGLLGVEAPSDSVNVLKDALGAAGEQIESARGKIREARTLLRINA